MVSRISRILMDVPLGVDIDSDNQFKLLKAYFNLRQLGDVKIYRTRKGYHLKVVNLRTNIHHRAGVGDDVNRLYLSEMRGGDDVLFDYKEVNGKGYWVEELDDDWILRLPFWHMQRRKRR